jgi:hypothetical protein
MCQFPERSCKDDEEGWWHDQSKFVHGKIMVDAMQQKVQRKSDPIVWEITRRRGQHCHMQRRDYTY